VFDLLEAVARCRRDGLPFHLTLVGPDEYPGEWDALKALTTRLGLADAVEFTGPLMGERLYERFDRADLFVLPSYNEGLPVVLHEAGAFGLPVITTPVGAIPDLIRDGANGLLIEPGAIDALAGAITRLVRDPAERRRLGLQLRDDVAAFHPDRVCERIATQVRETLAAGGVAR
jgi:glycosyltransferase involved in cell wall biosynthesis